MRLGSLRVRLLAAALVSISSALVIAGFGLVALFGQHVERRLDTQLETFIGELIGRIEPDGQGGIRLTHPLSDPRFEEPLSGLYWQIQDDAQRELIRSRSLWDQRLALPSDELELGIVHRHELSGPSGQSLLVREQQLIVFPETDAHRVRVTVAIDRSDLLHARAEFSRDLLPYLALLGGALLLATWLQVRTGLSPLDHVRRGVEAVRAGSEQRLTRAFPDEVQPLADEINTLLTSRDRAIEDARAWTADLAHGLKTPLAALTSDAQQLRARGEHAMADNLEQLAERMRQRVDRELIRARLRSEASDRGRQAELGQILVGLINTLRRTPSGAELDWQLALNEPAWIRIAPTDLTELLGNLLDNAAKWAKGRVRISARHGNTWQIDIEDDGPGVADEQLATLGQRGLRLDQQVAGTGLGLAIAHDIIEAYQGDLEFGRSDLGGLRVRVRLATASS